MKKHIRFLAFWLGLAFFPFLPLDAQNHENWDLDSLTAKVQELEAAQASPVELIYAHTQIAKYYFSQKEYKEALPSLYKAVDIADEEKLKAESFIPKHLIGSIFFYPLDGYDQSLEYLNQARTLADSFEVSPTYRLRNLSKLAEVQHAQGHTKEALELQFSTNEQAEKQKDWLNLAIGYRNVGVFFYSQAQSEDALKYLEEGLHYLIAVKEQNIDDPVQEWDRSLTHYNLIASTSLVYLKKAQMEDKNASDQSKNFLLQKAIKYLEQARRIADSVGHTYGVAYTDALQGSSYEAQNEPDSALKYLESAVNIYKKMNLKREWVSFSVSIAEQLLKLNKPYRALQYLEDAREVSDEINSPAINRNIYRTQYKVYEELDNIPLAFDYYKRYITLRDSLLNGNRTISQMEPARQVREKEIELENLKEEKKSSERQLWTALLIFSLIFFILMLYLGYNRNKTLRKINRVLSTKNDEIRRQNERLASSNEDLQQFAHVVSHDLREPLRSIGSFATLLQRRYQGKIDRDADEFIGFITAGVSRMDTLLSDLMTYSVVGIFQHELEPVNVNDVIQEIISTITRERGSLGARINIRNLPTIEADRKQLTQLFHHLIDNSIKFRSERPPEIAVEAIQQGSYYLFSVRDNGIGMDEAYREKIFGLFLRLHTRKSKYKGTGIGLSICKKIVEQHKGKIWIDSQLGVGTTVYFTLPQSPRDELMLDQPFQAKLKVFN